MLPPAAGCHSGSDPGSLLPTYGLHAELELAIDAGLSPLVAIQSASLNITKTWGKDKDFGSVEKGKVADLVIVRGDVMKDISATQNIEKVFMDGKAVDTSFNPNYRNPIPRTIADRYVTNLTELSPAMLVEGNSGSVKLAGVNFRPTHQVLINGKKIESRFVNGRELELKIPSLKPGTHKITVVDPGIPTSESAPVYLLSSRSSSRRSHRYEKSSLPPSRATGPRRRVDLGMHAERANPSACDPRRDLDRRHGPSCNDGYRRYCSRRPLSRRRQTRGRFDSDRSRDRRRQR